jgi:hypothetical protein
MITPAMLEGVTLWEILSESVGWHGQVLTDLDRHRLIRRLIGMEVTDLVQSTHERLRDSNVKSVEELQRLSYHVIGFSEDMHRRNRQLKDLLYNQGYTIAGARRSLRRKKAAEDAAPPQTQPSAGTLPTAESDRQMALPLGSGIERRLLDELRRELARLRDSLSSAP